MFTVALKTMVLDDVRVVQILKKVDFIFDHAKFSLALLKIGLFGQRNAFDGKQTTCSQIKGSVHFPKRSLSDQVIFLVNNLLAVVTRKKQVIIQIVQGIGAHG